METLIPILIVIPLITLLIIPPRKTRVWIVIVAIVAIGSLVFSNISFIFHALLRNTLALFGDLFGDYYAVVTLAISSALALLSYWLISKLLSMLFENRTVTVYTAWFIAGTIAGLSAYLIRVQLVLYASRMALGAAGLPATFLNQSIFDMRISALFFLSTSISGGGAGIILSRYRNIKGYAIWGVVGLTLGIFYQFPGSAYTIRQPDQTILAVALLLAPAVGAILLLIVCKACTGRPNFMTDPAMYDRGRFTLLL